METIVGQGEVANDLRTAYFGPIKTKIFYTFAFLLRGLVEDKNLIKNLITLKENISALL